MGNCQNCCSNNKSTKQPITLAVLGLDNAGKTVTSIALSGEKLDTVAPTIGFSDYDFVLKKQKIKMFDLGGGKNIRGIWKNYFAEIYGLIFIVDSSAESRIAECYTALSEVIQNPLISGKPLLLLANKQDINGALDEVDICESLALEDLVNKYQTPCRVEPCSALLGAQKKEYCKPIIQGLEWLIAMVNKDWENLHPRVVNDTEMKKAKDLKEKKEKTERVKRIREERARKEREERLARGEAENPESEEDEIQGDPFKRVSVSELEAKERQQKENKRKSHNQNITTRNNNSNFDGSTSKDIQKDEKEDNVLYKHKKSSSSLPPLNTAHSDLFTTHSRYDSPRPNKKLLGNVHLNSYDTEEEGVPKQRFPSSLDKPSWARKELEDISAPPLKSQFRGYNEDLDLHHGRSKGMLTPVGLLEPIGDLDKKKPKKKKKARKNQTVPEIIESGEGGDPGVMLSGAPSPAPRASRSPRLDTVQEPDDESDNNGSTSFSQKFNLIDELPDMRSAKSYRSHRTPNTDINDDIIT